MAKLIKWEQVSQTIKCNNVNIMCTVKIWWKQKHSSLCSPEPFNRIMKISIYSINMVEFQERNTEFDPQTPGFMHVTKVK